MQQMKLCNAYLSIFVYFQVNSIYRSHTIQHFIHIILVKIVIFHSETVSTSYVLFVHGNVMQISPHHGTA